MSDQTRDIFDIISTYFVNTYWFHLYKHAVDANNERQFPTLEDAYKVMVDRYRQAFCVTQDAQGRQNQNYNKIVADLQKNYNTWMQTDLSLGDFIDIVCRQIIPDDVYKKLSRQDNRKDELFRKAITQAVTNFTVFVATRGLVDVIRNRTSKQAMAAWKEEYIRIMYSERDELYGRFMASKSGVDPTKIQKNQISREAFDKMTEHLKRVIYEKAKVQKELNLYIAFSKKQREVDQSKIAELEALLAGATAGRPAPRRQAPAALPRVEVVQEAAESVEDSSEEPSEASPPKLERINDPAKDDFLKKKTGVVEASHITKALDDVPEYSGEDFVSKGPPDEDDSSEYSSGSMSMDE